MHRSALSLLLDVALRDPLAPPELLHRDRHLWLPEARGTFNLDGGRLLLLPQENERLGHVLRKARAHEELDEHLILLGETFVRHIMCRSNYYFAYIYVFLYCSADSCVSRPGAHPEPVMRNQNRYGWPRIQFPTII